MRKIVIEPLQGLTHEAFALMHREMGAASREDEIVLRLPGRLPALDPFRHGQLLHLVISWGRGAARPVLDLTGGPFSVEEFEGLLPSSDIILIACGFAVSVFGVQGSPGWHEHLDLVKAALLHKAATAWNNDAGSLVLAHHWPELAHSGLTHAASAEGWKINEEARTLYHAVWPDPATPESLRDPFSHLGEHVRPSATGEPVIERLNADSTPFATLAQRAFRFEGLAEELANAHSTSGKPAHDHLGEVLFELFQNTDWHGRQITEGFTGRSFQSFRFSTLAYSVAQPTEIDAQPVVGAYVRNLIAGLNAEGRGRVSQVVIGVVNLVDSGMGLAKSAAQNLGQSHLLNETTEMNFLKLALEKNIKVSFKQMGNIGLSRVQLILTNLRGFMLVRTGSVEIHRDFVARPVRPRSAGNHSRDPQFFDWIPGNYEQLDAGPHKGTDVTVAVPIQIIMESDRE